jgi:NADH dehydrogenase
MRYVSTVTLAAVGAVVVALRWRAARRPPAPPRPIHVSESEQAFLNAGTRVVILGAGFGGLAAALTLDHLLGGQRDVSVLVIDRDNSSLFTPLLWTVADGRADAADVVVPIREFQRGRRFHVLQAEVRGIDVERRQVQLDVGVRPYDYLVIALGSVTQFPPLPGVVENARPFRTPADAISLRDQLIDAVEAAHRATSEDERRAWLTFVVVGGGDTGVELAGVIHSYLAAGLLAEYPWLANHGGGPAFRVVLVGRAPRLLPMGLASDSDTIRRILEREGVEVLTNTSVEAVRPDAVVTSRGEIHAHTVFWAAGISPTPVLRDLPVKHAKGGTIVVDDHLRLPGHPEVSVVGDAAWAFDTDGRPVPPTAQASEYTGAYVGRAIAAMIRGQSETAAFRYAPLGHLALLGPGQALARVGPILLSGRLAWLAWHAYYLYRIPTWKRRIELLSSWIVAASFGREVAQLRVGRVGSVSGVSSPEPLPAPPSQAGSEPA